MDEHQIKSEELSERFDRVGMALGELLIEKLEALSTGGKRLVVRVTQDPETARYAGPPKFIDLELVVLDVVADADAPA